MQRLLPAIALLLFTALLLPCAAQAEKPRGWFGIGVTMPGGGIRDLVLNKTVGTLLISSVAPGSPAERAGIAVGDEMVAVDGVPVAGRKMRDILPMVSKAEGETLRLLMRRPAGDTYTAALTGARRPE